MPTPPIPAAHKLVIDSKFRRETNNFKVNFDGPSTLSDDPVLIKYIEKNLKPEELLGLIVVVSRTYVEEGRTYLETITASIGEIQMYPEGDTIAYTLSTQNNGFYYVPSTGALSLNAPYVEEEEGGETEARLIDLTKLEYEKNAKGIETWSGYEAGLGVDDFEGAKVITQAGTQDVTNVVDWPIGKTSGFTIKLTISGTGELTYNPSTGQFRSTPTS